MHQLIIQVIPHQDYYKELDMHIYFEHNEAKYELRFLTRLCMLENDQWGAELYAHHGEHFLKFHLSQHYVLSDNIIKDQEYLLAYFHINKYNVESFASKFICFIGG